MEHSKQLNKVFFPLIAYGGQCRGEFSLACSSLLIKSIDRKDIDIGMIGMFHESLISRARNIAAAYAIKEGYSHLLFIDSDIYFDPKDVFRLIEANEDVIAGAYPKKYINDKKLSFVAKKNNSFISEKKWISLSTDFTTEITDNTIKENMNGSQLLEVDYAATGFMLIKVGVFEKIAQKFPEIKYINDIDAYMSLGDNFYDFFPAQVNKDTKKFESEDYGFCRLWRSIGGKIKIMSDINLTHIGSLSFSGNLKQQLNYFK
jgi:hypothetical protein